MDVAGWLRDLGLQQYEPLFRENDIGSDLLATLTPADLRELGITSLGHRKRLLNAVLALSEAASGISATPPSPAERRLVTVLFCDLVGSTQLSRELDPEDFEVVIHHYQGACSDVVARYDGRLLEFLGDGVLVYFGHPRAHEDDTERAVRAGLDLAETVGRLALPSRTSLKARIGIATGLVVTGNGAAADEKRQLLGETPNLASRLQAVAEPGTVVIDLATRRLVVGLFELADLGPMTLKGIMEPVHATRVLCRRPVNTRSEVVHSFAAATPLIGRDQEIALLLHRWRQVQNNEGRVVLLSGEPGIGKSRIVAGLLARLADERYACLQYFCSPHHQSSALFPIIRQLEQASGFTRTDSPEIKHGKLNALLSPAIEGQNELALIADLLTLPEFTPSSCPGLSPQRRKKQLLDALLMQLVGIASQKPTLVLFEDVHWIDPTSLNLLELAVERVRALPVLLIVTFRPEFRSSWAGMSHVTALTLGGLSRTEATALVGLAAGVPGLPPAAVAEIVDRTDGIPLFVEELARAVAEGDWPAVRTKSGSAEQPADSRHVPAALHAPLMSRFDRLGPARGVAQVGATIGREFSYELLAAVTLTAEEDLPGILGQLEDAGLISRRGSVPWATFQFKHALVQDAVYGTLLHTTRRDLHTRIVKALEVGFPDIVEAQPELLAQHCTHADLVDEAVEYWSKAGQRAIARSAMPEAAEQLRRAIMLLPRLAETRTRKQRELDLTTMLGTALIAAKGYTDQETGRAYSRARVLCAELGDASRLMAAVRGQCSYHLVRGEVSEVLSAATDLLAESERQGDRGMRLTAHQLLGIGVFYAGHLHQAREHLATAAELLEAVGEDAAQVASGRDALVGIPSYRAVLLVLLGHYDEARAQNALGLTMARQQARPHRLAFTLATTVWFHTLLNEDASASLAELSALAAEQGYPYWSGFVLMCQGIALCQAGNAAAGVKLARRGVAHHDAVGAAWSVPILLATLAATVGDGDAQALVDDAFARTASMGVNFYMPEYHRLRARLLIGAGNEAEAATQYATSLSIARQQGARHWELRTTTDLAGLLWKQGQRPEAHDLLVRVCGTFADGPSTTDLRRAWALLQKFEASQQGSLSG